MSVTESLIKAVEIWVPNDAESQLELAGGAYGDLHEFREASLGLTFDYGQPFPGVVWKERSPWVLPDLYVNEFARSEAARKAGLTSGLAIPVLKGDKTCAVVVLLCNQTDGAQGAFEVWKRDSREELELTSQYYANTQHANSISDLIRFPRAAGLPGRVWDDELPCIIDRLASTSGSAWSSSNGAKELDLAMGLPIMHGVQSLDSVVLILSATKTPMARGFEIWTAERDGYRMRQSAYVGMQPDETIQRSRELVEQVATLRRPVALEGERGAASDTSQLWSLGIPVFVGRELRSIVTMIN